jgi:beta-lactamase superfamily II metal-dependent hydrolase
MAAPAGPPLTLQVFDVGQGDGLFLTFPSGATMIVDLGSTKNLDLVWDSIKKWFAGNSKFSSAGQTLDYLVLTHPDRDHYNLIPRFCTTFTPKIRYLLYSGNPSQYAAGALMPALAPYGPPQVINVPSVPCDLTGTGAGSLKEFGAEVRVLAINVAATGTAGYVKNTLSIVLQIAYKGIRLLLTGDATRHTEQVALASGGASIASTVLKVPHHGSHRTSNAAGFIQAVAPYWAFISSDRQGTLDEDTGEHTGHRLPQYLTADLLQRYGNLQKNVVDHGYVSAYQASDYDEYNANPDFAGAPLPKPAAIPDNSWVQTVDKSGVFCTLATMGVGAADADQGHQYQVTVLASGALDLQST